VDYRVAHTHFVLYSGGKLMNVSMIEAYNDWKTNPFFDDKTRAEVAALTDPKEIEDRFYKELEFGTGGMRGVMGAGLNRMNRYVIRRASLGLAKYLKSEYSEAELARGVAIDYDSRNNSREFALEAALTLCRQGIPVHFMAQMMPTPVLSYTVRALGCISGATVTASHNPKEYNGFKVYNSTGCQMLDREADRVIENINAIKDFSSVEVMELAEAEASGLLTYVDESILDGFTAEVEKQAHELSAEAKSALKVVYTPLHGTGNIPVRRALAKLGYTDVTVVAEQEKPDGNFSTVRSPNPEDRAALLMGIDLAEKTGADIVVGTDPDCDRVAVAARDGEEFVLFTGNQTGALITEYVLSRRAGSLPKSPVVIKTVVTSDLGGRIAESYGVKVMDTLTGFKFICDIVNGFEKTGESFILGYEESYGYLIGDHVRDKDAVVSSMLICEMAA